MSKLPAARDSEYPSELRPIASGELFAGRYRLLATLGRGGMANVYLGAAAGPAGFNKLVVIKKLHSGTDDPALVEMFLDEARLAARLNHPNIVHTYEVDESPDGYLLVMEYLEGQSLRHLAKAVRARDNGFDPVLAAYLVSEALEGLHYVHEMRDYDGSPLDVVHRDISPQNVFVTYEGQVKVLDFGIAKHALNVTDTQSGMLKGKVSYMAPEQAKDGDVDRRADLFSAGVVLWELLTGHKLFKGDTVATLRSLMTGPIDPPSSRAPDVPPELDRIVLKALSRSPDGRFATALAMSKALSDFVRSSGRTIRREDVAARMLELFGIARETMARRVQAYMASRANDVTGPTEPVVGASVIPTTTNAVPLSGVRRAIRKRPLIPLAAGGLALVLLGATLLWVRPRPSARAEPARATPLGETAPRALEGIGSHPEAARTDSDPTFHLTLGSDPPEAQVEWGGNVIGQTPMLIDLSTGPQTFVLSRDGYFKATVVMTITDAMTGRNESRTVVMLPRHKGRSAAALAAQAARAGAGAGAGAKSGIHPSTAIGPSAPVAATPAPAQGAPPSDPFGAGGEAPAPSPPTAKATPAATAVEPDIPASPAPAAAPPATATAPMVLPFGPEMTRPTLVSGGQLVYPREAIVAGITGTIIVKCTITTDGVVRNCRIIKGLPFLDKPTLDVLATRRYSPVLHQGKPVSVEYVFNLKVAPPTR